MDELEWIVTKGAKWSNRNPHPPNKSPQTLAPSFAASPIYAVAAQEGERGENDDSVQEEQEEARPRQRRPWPYRKT